jgi:hypothetical protein
MSLDSITPYQGQLRHIRALVIQLKESTNALLVETARLQTLQHPSPSLRDLVSKLQTVTGTVTSLEMLLERQQLPANSHPSAVHRPPATSTFQQEPTSHICSSPQHRQGQAYLPRISLPSFGGEVQDYWEFREVFRSLVEGVYLEPSVYIMQLKNQLAPKEAKNMLQGVRSIPEAWGILDSHYGDRLAAITTITATLRNHKTTGQAAHEKLEGLVQAVRQATVSLKHVQAEKTLSHDFSLISSLIEKLPAAYVDRWGEFRAAQEKK